MLPVDFSISIIWLPGHIHIEKLFVGAVVTIALLHVMITERVGACMGVSSHRPTVCTLLSEAQNVLQNILSHQWSHLVSLQVSPDHKEKKRATQNTDETL
jgi:hypothetical protein